LSKEYTRDDDDDNDDDDDDNNKFLTINVLATPTRPITETAQEHKKNTQTTNENSQNMTIRNRIYTSLIIL